MTTSECRARLRAWLRDHPNATTAEVRAAVGGKRRRVLLDLHAIGAVLTFDPAVNSARWRLPEDVCPKCGERGCWRDSADVGVGVVYGPWGCPDCGWSEHGEYDLSSGQSPRRDGGVIDQWGGLTPRGWATVTPDRRDLTGAGFLPEEPEAL